MSYIIVCNVYGYLAIGIAEEMLDLSVDLKFTFGLDEVKQDNSWIFYNYGLSHWWCTCLGDMYLINIHLPLVQHVDYKITGVYDWLGGVYHPVMYASGYVRRISRGHGIGCLWLLLLRPITGGVCLPQGGELVNKEINNTSIARCMQWVIGWFSSV